MCKLYHLFPDGTERREKSSEALESPGQDEANVQQKKARPARRRLEWVEKMFSENRPIQLKVLHKMGKSTLFRTFLKRHQLKIALGTGSTILTG